MSLRKKQNVPATPIELSDKTSSQRWPELWQHLTSRHYDEGKKEPRQTSTITLFRGDDGLLRAVLKDRDNDCACFAAGHTLMGLLDSLEAVAGHPDTQWREDRNLTGASSRRKKA